VIQLKVLNGERAGTDLVADYFPVTVGRSSANDLRLPVAGVWDRHCEIRLNPPDFRLAAIGQAITTVNGQPVAQASLANGDVIGLGSLEVLFTLSPTMHRGMRWREWLVWLLFGAVALGQIALVYWLPG
jgi:pSer/pThr/pTyr-binding forkhead associated (FHA) protein